MKKNVIRTFLLTLLLTLLFSTSVFAEETTPMYATANVNVRSGDSASAKKLGTLSKGQAVATSGKTEKGWYVVDYNGQTGYVSGKYLTTANSTTATAETTTPASSAAQNTTRTFSNGQTFVARGKTPGGLTIWYMSDDNGTWPDYMINAYDATGVTDDMSDYDKAVAINNYICSVVEPSQIGDEDKALYSACLTYGRANCVGYSHAFDCLCTMAGVYSNQVVGSGNNGAAHAWNYVLIGDTKYWVDVAYNDGSNNAYLMSTSELPGHVVGYEN